MSTLSTLVEELLDDATVEGLVDDRVFIMLRPQGTALPCLVLGVVSEVPENSLTGTATDRLSNYRVQVDAYAATYAGARALASAADAVISALQSSDLAAEKINSRDFYENDSGMGIHRVSSDFSVWE